MKPLTKTGSDLMMLLTAIIWGFAFVAQRAGMEFIGPFTFNACRFLMGGFLLLPFIFLRTDNYKQYQSKNTLKGGIVAGILLFGGASFQQLGIVFTTAGNAGFITGFYVVLVPILGLLFFKHKTGINIWIGAFLALTGIYFLSIKQNLSISKGDLLVFLGACVWAFHVLVIGKYAPLGNAIKIAVIQFLICGILSLLFALLTEPIMLSAIKGGLLPIFYGGVFSVAIAFTLQVIAQKNAHPSLAALLLSSESLFALLGGWFILDEIMSNRALFGCLLMLCGIILSQLKMKFKSKNI